VTTVDIRYSLQLTSYPLCRHVSADTTLLLLSSLKKHTNKRMKFERIQFIVIMLIKQSVVKIVLSVTYVSSRNYYLNYSRISIILGSLELPKRLDYSVENLRHIIMYIMC
jgi:hypothetical protein